MIKFAASLIIISLLFPATLSAQDDVTTVTVNTTTVTTTTHNVNSDSTIIADNINKSTIYDKQKNESTFARHFAWGATLGSSIDMTGQDMTTIDIDAFFGYKGDYIRFAGAGAGIKMMVSNSSRSYPVYAMLRTSFTKSINFLYLELKGGVAFNNLYTDVYQRNFIGGIAIGFTLAHSRTFSSNFSLGYEYMPLSHDKIDGIDALFDDLHYASIRIGASF